MMACSLRAVAELHEKEHGRGYMIGCKELLLHGYYAASLPLRMVVNRCDAGGPGLALAYDLSRVDIVAQAEEHGRAQAAVTCPFGELGLDDDLGTHPRRLALDHRHVDLERRRRAGTSGRPLSTGDSAAFGDD